MERLAAGLYRHRDTCSAYLLTSGREAVLVDPGSVPLVAEVGGRRVALAGDLLHGPGRLGALAAPQWSYNGAEGVAATLLSLLDLRRRAPDLILPSHGEPIAEPGPAIDLLLDRLR